MGRKKNPCLTRVFLEAAGDAEDGGGDVAGFGGEEPEDGGGDLFGGGDAGEGDAGGEAGRAGGGGSPAAAWISVWVVPGETALMRVPVGASSLPRPMVKASMAALVAA